VAKPVIGETTTVAPAVQPRTYAPAPAAYSSGGWSTLPRSSWDYGKFPPYSN
jgi:hypothetical protein